jgi:hypothetical protein
MVALTRSGIRAGTCAFITVLAAASGAGGTASRQSAIVYLTEPTLIGSTLVQGPVLYSRRSEVGPRRGMHHGLPGRTRRRAR